MNPRRTMIAEENGCKDFAHMVLVGNSGCFFGQDMTDSIVVLWISLENSVKDKLTSDSIVHSGHDHQALNLKMEI